MADRNAVAVTFTAVDDNFTQTANNIVGKIGEVDQHVKDFTASSAGFTSASIDMRDAIAAFGGRVTDAGDDVEELRRVAGGLGTTVGTTAEATHEAATAAEGWKDSLVEVAGALGLITGAAGLVEATTRAIEFGASIEHLSIATGVSTDELQRLNYAAAQVGVPLEALAQSVDRMQRNITDASPQVQAAFSNLGLDLRQIQQMDAAAMFDAVSEALSKVPNHAQAVSDAFAIMGRTSPQVLALMLSNVQELEQGARVMSEDTVRNLAAFDDAWKGAITNIESEIGDFVGHLHSIPGAITEFFQVLNQGQPTVFNLKEGIDSARDAIDKNVGAMADSAAAALQWGQTLDTAAGSVDLAEQQLKRLTEAHKAEAEAVKQEAEAEQRARDEEAKSNAMLQEALRKLQAERQAEYDAENAHELESERQLSFALERVWQDRVAAQERADQEAANFEVENERQLNDALNEVQQERQKEADDAFNKHIGELIGGFSSLEKSGVAALEHIGSEGVSAMQDLKGIKDSLHDISNADSWEGAIAGAISFAGALAGAVSIIGDIVSGIAGLFNNSGRDAVVNFANSYGGFDILHNLLGNLPDGEDLWIKLTQQVGSGDEAGANQIINQIKQELAAYHSPNGPAAAPPGPDLTNPAEGGMVGTGPNKLSSFASGGFVAHPTVAVVGDAPGGEIISPIPQLAQAVAQGVSTANRVGDEHLAAMRGEMRDSFTQLRRDLITILPKAIRDAALLS